MGIIGDNPIEDTSEDSLGRSTVASTIAATLREVNVENGCVVAIMGPWGSGKTSLMNLVRHELHNSPSITVLEFNPWMFSGAEQLVDAFFRELAAQLHLKQGRLDQIATEVAAYGDLLQPAADVVTILSALPFGSWFDRAGKAAKAVKNFQERRKVGVGEQRKKLQQKLRELESPIVVMLDDIDRLSTSEIRHIFKLVRLTASFPNVIYVLAFDRKRVEDALSEDGLDGRSYLEKIVQLSFEIPSVPDGVLVSQVLRALGQALDGVPAPTRFDADRWTDVFAEIVLPLIRNMRDVRRYGAAVHAALQALGQDIELVDILALEAIRVFLPDLYASLTPSQAALTAASNTMTSAAYGRQITSFLAASGSDAVGRAVIARLFPAALGHISQTSYGHDFQATWLKDRRVAHLDILRFYLERQPGSGLLNFTDAEWAFAVLEDEGALDQFLRSIDLERLESVISALENYESDFTTASALPGTVVLLNLLPILPDKPRAMFGLDTRIIVTRVVLRLLRRLPDQDAVAKVVREAIPKVSTLSSRAQLIVLVGHQEHAGHKLVSEADASELENDLIKQVRSATASDLATDWDLLRLLNWARGRVTDGTSLLPTLDDDPLNSAVLTAAKADVRSQSHDSRTVKYRPRLAWDILLALYGSEDEIVRVVDKLEESQGETDVTKLAKRYLGGWRPKDFGDD